MDICQTLCPSAQKLEVIKKDIPLLTQTLSAMVCVSLQNTINVQLGLPIPVALCIEEVDLRAVGDLITYLNYVHAGE